MKIRNMFKMATFCMAMAGVLAVGERGVKAAEGTGGLPITQSAEAAVQTENLEVISDSVTDRKTTTELIFLHLNKDLPENIASSTINVKEEFREIATVKKIRKATAEERLGDHVYVLLLDVKKSGRIQLDPEFSIVTDDDAQTVRKYKLMEQGASVEYTGDVEVHFGKERIEVEEVDVNGGSFQDVTEITLKLKERLSASAASPDLFLLDESIFQVREVTSTDMRTFLIKGTPKKNAFLTLPAQTNKEEGYRSALVYENGVSNRVKIRVKNPEADTQKRVKAKILTDGKEKTRFLTLELEGEIPNLRAENLLFHEQNTSEDISNFFTVKSLQKMESESGKSKYKIEIDTKKSGQTIVFDEILNGRDDYVLGFETGGTGNYFSTIPVHIKKGTETIRVVELTAKEGDLTDQLTLRFNTDVYDLKPEDFIFTPADIMRIEKIMPDPSHRSLVLSVSVKRAGAVMLEEIRHEDYHVANINEGFGVDLKYSEFFLFVPEVYEVPKVDQSKDAEAEKKTEEETRKEADEKTEEAKPPKDKIVQLAGNKTLNVVVKEEAVKEALEQHTSLVIRNKRQKVVLTAENVKEIVKTGMDLRLTLKAVKEKIFALKGKRFQKVYDFKINERAVKLKENLRLTLKFDKKVPPKLYHIDGKGRLIQIKGVKWNKKKNKISFETKNVRKFVVTY